MRRYSFVGIIFILVTALFTNSLTAKADTPPDQLYRDVVLVDSIGWVSPPGVIFTAGSSNTSHPCNKGFANPNCNIQSPLLTIFNALGPCDSDFSTPCIEDIWAESETGVLVKGIHSGERILPMDSYAFQANKQLQLSQSRSSNLYKFPGIRHDQGDLFEVVPNLRRSIANGVLQAPVSLTTTIQGVYIDKLELPPKFGGLIRLGIKSGAELVPLQLRCMGEVIGSFAAQVSDCWKQATHPRPITFRVAFRLPTLPSGWVNGRLLHPEVVFEELSGSENQLARVTITGATLQVPSLYKSYYFVQQDEKVTWDKLTSVFGIPWTNQNSTVSPMSPTDITRYISAKDLDPTMDIATQVNSKWTSNLDWENTLPQNTKCVKKGFLGYVGSNSLTYATVLPTFDPTDGSLNYQVASPHFMPGGKEFSGYYELLVNEEYARCVWGISVAPIRASISVLNDAGQVKIVSTSVKLKEGVLGFQAAGFTFSTNRIKAKLEAITPTPTPTASATPSATATPTASPSPTPSATLTSSPTPSPIATAMKVALKSIICQKGKVKKKVTSTNPKCPAGFKKV